MAKISTTVRSPEGQPANGLQLLRAFVAGNIEPPPVANLIGFEFLSADAGEVAMELRAGKRHENPMGTLHGGILCDLGDAAMGCSVATTLDHDESFTTIELKINFFKPVYEGTRLRAFGRVVRRTRTLAFTECEVLDDGDSLVAKLASTCMVLRGEAAQGR